MNAWRATSAALALGLGASSAGCQYFFPTPIEQLESARETPRTVARAVGAPFRVGEVMKAEVFLDSIRGGTGELRVTEACDAYGKPAVLVVLNAASTGLARMLKSADVKSESFVDQGAGLPISAHADTVIGDEDTDMSTLYAPSKYMFRQKRTIDVGNAPTTRVNVESDDIPIEQVPHNGDSLLGFLRNWKPPPGTSGYAFAVFGRYPWRADMTFVGPETITTARGEEKSLRIDGVGQKLVGGELKELKPSALTPKRPFSIWISDDDRRAPLRILLETEIAKVTIELTSYEIVPVKGDASAACKPLFDGEALEHEATRAAQTRKAARLELMLPPSPDGAKPGDHDDDDKEEKDGIQKLLKLPQ